MKFLGHYFDKMKRQKTDRLNAPALPPATEADGRIAADPVPIGRQIRELRRSRNVKLSDLAARVGRSIGNISEIERGLSPLTITVLQDIAGALGVSISWFFSGNAVAPSHERDLVVRADNRRRINFAGAGTTEELLSPGLESRFVIIETTFSPGSGTGEKHRVRKGEEAGVVISGQLELHTEGQVYLLETGDSFSLKGEGSHLCRNPGETDTVVMWVISPPNY